MSTSKQTPLYGLHQELGAKETVFGGYLMPLSYPNGSLQEHRHTRARAGLFDISHMGQARIRVAPDAFEKIAAPFTGDIDTLAPGEMVYSLMTNDAGGIHDDVIVSRLPEGDSDGDGFHITVNAGGKETNLAYLTNALKSAGALQEQDDKALLALQGPDAARVMESELGCSLADLFFMQSRWLAWKDVTCLVARCGYTGEDGFEISIPATHAEAFARALLSHDAVEAIGLGARDSLRLEAGLSLYGQDITATTTPIEAGLAFFVSKRRRERKDFPGSDTIIEQLKTHPDRHLVGLLPQDKALLRPHTEILDKNGATIGEVTSGGFGASFGGAVALGYVAHGFEKPESEVFAKIRSREIAARVTRLPFVKHNYYRK
ncbi:MAG: glycine cleavage system aminomethyltransferase GcvT [Hyphomicrobiales bacterium]|nr:glycine cleavage system aminomethyltransferase GcvT [Hyphomicrobiales bacterium]